MSLKVFHIVFISVSALLAFGFGAWILIANSGASTPMNFVYAFLSIVVGVALVVYGFRFLRKFRNVKSM